MKLRRLRVSGFKTFARDTEVLFDRGITAIVGPNGSGKSNLVDAVRWALGETNARELRGQRMDEVIYSGGGGRPRLGVAEVDLVLDNEGGELPLEDPEVALSRRVVRGAGDTVFRLNGDRVRLRDIERLLTATGLTQSGYAVVAQNDIDAIIEATPTHRRMLVEQAAGVRHLRAAGDEALNKVGHAEAVIRRLDDLLDDAEPRLLELAEQAHAALDQRAVTERLSELRGSLAREEWRAARGRLRQARRTGDQAAARLEAASAAERAFSDRIDAERSALSEARAAYTTALESLEDARLGAERAAGDHRRWLDRMRVAVIQRAEAGGESRSARVELETAVSVSNSRLAALREDVAERQGAADRAAAEAHLAEAIVQSSLETADKARRLRRDIEAHAAALREATADVLARAASVKGSLAGIAGGEGGVARAVAAGKLSARRLWDCLSVRSAGSVAAVEAALEPYIGAWVVDDVEAAAGFLDPSGPREQLLQAGLPPVRGLDLVVPGEALLGILEVDGTAAGAVARCLAGTWLAPDLASARAALGGGAAAAVLQDGTVITEAGVRGGGRPGRVLGLAADERRLAEEVHQARAAEAAATAEVGAAHDRAGAAETSLARAGDESRSARMLAAETTALAAASLAALDALEMGDDDARRLLRTASSRHQNAELRLLAAEGDTIVSLVRLSASAGEFRRLREGVHAARTAADERSKPLAALERGLVALEAERSDVAVALARAEDERAAAVDEIAAAEAQVRNLAEAVIDESEEEIDALDTQAVERAEREILRLERRVAAMGPVNALAPEQHEELTARVSRLQRDRADLGVACEDVRELVRWLTEHLDERFDAIFGAVSFHFHQLFSELFPGGKATLRLEEMPKPEDDAEHERDRRAGVEILAQPPGKRLGPLRLLSGGERALTALAVILALQQVNPSPFYIFDEVDAALDDSNVLRFVRLVRRLSADQQFIVVTHNHLTMAAADSLWGVTIDSEGVSTALGVRFDDEKRAARRETTLTQSVAVHAG
jgi:chromosome segregation protein